MRTIVAIMEAAHLELRRELSEYGGCDHSVNICSCGLQNLVDEMSMALAYHLPCPAKCNDNPNDQDNCPTCKGAHFILNTNKPLLELWPSNEIKPEPVDTGLTLYACSIDPETYHFTVMARNAEEAVQQFIASELGLDEGLPREIHVGKAVKPNIMDFEVDVVSVLEQIGEQASEEYGEHADGWPDSPGAEGERQLQADLSAVVHVWMMRHHIDKTDFFTVEVEQPFTPERISTMALPARAQEAIGQIDVAKAQNGPEDVDG